MSKRANGEGSVRKKGRVWYVRIFAGGTRREIKTDAESRTEALDKLSKLKTKAAEGTYDPNADKTRVEDLYQDMRSDYVIKEQRVDDLDRRWKHIAPAFGRDRAKSVTTPRLRQYVESRIAGGAARATVQREIAALRRMFRLGLESDKVVRVPSFPTIQVHNARSNFFERDDFERVRSELAECLRPIVTVAYWTGWRKGELLALEWPQVDLEAGTVRLAPGTTKNKEGRLVYLPPEALEALRAWRIETTKVERLQSRIIKHVFHRSGKPIRDFYGAWRAACKRAKVPGRYLHDFRRTAARNYVRAGVNERIAMSILGHKTRSIFDRYNITSESDLRTAAQRVGNSVGEALGKVVPLPSRDKEVATSKS